MRIAYNPKSAGPLKVAPTGDYLNAITFDLADHTIYTRGEMFKGTDTTYEVFKKATQNAVGYNGLVPAPSYTTTSIRFLREDGTWQVPYQRPIKLGGGDFLKSSDYNKALDIHSGNGIVINSDSTGKITISSTLEVDGDFSGTISDAFTLIKVGSSTLKATVNKILTLSAGSGITLTPNTTSNIILIAANTMKGATSSAAGTSGMVPAPSTSNTGLFLRGDGTWATPSNWTTHLYIGAKDTASNAATTNGNTYIKVTDNSTIRNQYIIKGSGNTSVSSDASGNITINSPTTISWGNVTNKPGTFAPSAHNHSLLAGWADTRSTANVPNDYNGVFKILGIKTSGNTLGLTSSLAGSYATIIGWRGWSDSSGGYAWEIASTDKNRLYVRSGNTTSWNNGWSAIAYISDLTWSNISGKPSTFAPSAHNHPTSQINALTGYSKAGSAANLTTTDTLNAALGKLEYKAHYAYDWVISVTSTDTDKYINKWGEIVGFLDSVKEGTDILDEFVTRKTALVITGQKNFNTNTGATPVIISRGGGSTEAVAIGINDSQAVFEYTNDEKANSYVFKMINTDAEASGGSGANTSLVTFAGSSAGSSVTATTFIGRLNNTLTFSAGAFATKTYNNSSAVTVNIPTHTSHLTNNSGFLTLHLSLANYVTLNSVQTITGAKTFSGGFTLNCGLNINSTNPITWNDGTYWQRIQTTDDTTNNTAVFTFQQSTNSGSSWTDLFTIKDNGNVVSTKFITSGGTSSLFVKGDGSLDSTSYATSASLGNYVKKAGDTMTGRLTMSTTIVDHSSPTQQCLVINSAAVPSGTKLSLKNSPGIGFHIASTIWASLVLSTGGFHFINDSASGYVNVNALAFISAGGTSDFSAGTIKFDTINIPTSSGGTTYGVGSNGLVLKSNGSTVYWGTDNNSWRAIQTNGTQIASTSTGSYALNFVSGTGITVSGAAGSSSTANTITITNSGVRSVTIGSGNNANKLAVNTNGSTTYLTIPYATTAANTTVTLHNTNDIEYPLIWSNQNNNSTKTANLLYKSYSDLTYNPKNKRITANIFKGNLLGNINPFTSISYTPETSTVKNIKDALVTAFTNVNTGIGANVIVPAYAISYWSTESTIIKNSNVYSMIKIGGGYSGTSYGQWLLSTYASNRIGYVGRDSNAWGNIYWLANTDDINTLKNYYWANIKISATSSATTKPTFAKWTTSDLNLVSYTNGGKDLGMRVTGSINSIGFIVGSNNTSRGIYDYTNGVWIIRKDNSNNTLLESGNVGIGTSSPSQKLHVGGLVNITANSGTLTIGSLNASYTHYSTTGGTHWFNKAVEVNGNLSPHANNSFTLGTSSKRWSNVYSVLGNYSGLITATSGIQIGSTADIGWYLYDSRICAGTNTARNVNVGSLLVSNAWADSSKVPTNGIYSKGNVSAAGFVKASSSDSYVLLGGGGHKALSDFLLESELATLELSTNVTTLTKSLTVTAAWMDTGINYTDLPANGTYIVQLTVSGASNGTGSMYYCYWSGVMSWYKDSTNDSESDEILLHRSGHAYGNTIYLRTIMTTNSDGRHLRLLIAANKDLGAAYTYTFKFKRII